MDALLEINPSHTKPTIFELLAERKLQELIEPAYSYVITIYAQRYPSLLRLHQIKDWIFVVLHGLIEYHYLTEWGCSSTESFYGLKRTKNKMGLSLLGIIILPSIKRFFDYLYEQWSVTRSQVFGDLFASSGGSRVKKFLVNLYVDIYPWINKMLHVSRLAFLLGYVYERTPFSSPWLYLCGIRLERQTMQDYVFINNLESHS